MSVNRYVRPSVLPPDPIDVVAHDWDGSRWMVAAGGGVISAKIRETDSFFVTDKYSLTARIIVLPLNRLIPTVYYQKVRPSA